MAKARLLTAYFWNCDDCGAENFERSQIAEFVDDADREAAYRRFNELDEWVELPEGWREFEIVTSPDLVTCGECGSTFETEDDRNESA